MIACRFVSLLTVSLRRLLYFLKIRVLPPPGTSGQFIIIIRDNTSPLSLAEVTVRTGPVPPVTTGTGISATSSTGSTTVSSSSSAGGTSSAGTGVSSAGSSGINTDTSANHAGSSSGSSSGTAAAVSVVVILLVLIVAGVLGVLWWRRRHGARPVSAVDLAAYSTEKFRVDPKEVILKDALGQGAVVSREFFCFLCSCLHAKFGRRLLLTRGLFQARSVSCTRLCGATQMWS